MALVVVVTAAALFFWVYDPGTDFYIPPPQPAQQRYIPFQVPKIEVRAGKFDAIIAQYSGGEFIAYPEYPYTLEISGDGKIKFTNDIFPKGVEGKISPAQISALLKSLNDNNFQFIAKLPQPGPSYGTLVCPSDSGSAEVTVVIDGIKIIPALGCLASVFYKEYNNFVRAIDMASEKFIKESFVKAAAEGNKRAQCWLDDSKSNPCWITATNPTTTSP